MQEKRCKMEYKSYSLRAVRRIANPKDEGTEREIVIDKATSGGVGDFRPAVVRVMFDPLTYEVDPEIWYSFATITEERSGDTVHINVDEYFRGVITVDFNVVMLRRRTDRALEDTIKAVEDEIVKTIQTGKLQDSEGWQEPDWNVEDEESPDTDDTRPMTFREAFEPI